MNAEDLIAFRKSAALTQAELAALVDMSLRAIQRLENDQIPLRRIHQYAFERLSLRLAADLKSRELVLPSVQADLKVISQ